MAGSGQGQRGARAWRILGGDSHPFLHLPLPQGAHPVLSCGGRRMPLQASIRRSWPRWLLFEAKVRGAQAVCGWRPRCACAVLVPFCPAETLLSLQSAGSGIQRPSEEPCAGSGQAGEGGSPSAPCISQWPTRGLRKHNARHRPTPCKRPTSACPFGQDPSMTLGGRHRSNILLASPGFRCLLSHKAAALLASDLPSGPSCSLGGVGFSLRKPSKGTWLEQEGRRLSGFRGPSQFVPPSTEPENENPKN